MDSVHNALESTKALAIDAMGAIDQQISSLGLLHEDMDQSRRSRFSFSSSSSSLSLHESRSHCSVVPPDRLRCAFDALSLTEDDVKNLIDQEGGLELLKKSLRREGAVTNCLVKQGLHLYVREQKMSSKGKVQGVVSR